MLFLSSPPRIGGGDRKKGEEEVLRRPSPSGPCLDPDDAGIIVLEEEECVDEDDFEEARIFRR